MKALECIAKWLMFWSKVQCAATKNWLEKWRKLLKDVEKWRAWAMRWGQLWAQRSIATKFNPKKKTFQGTKQIESLNNFGTKKPFWQKVCNEGRTTSNVAMCNRRELTKTKKPIKGRGPKSLHNLWNRKLLCIEVVL